ncbi:hypothetical protein Sjap_017358 [Stephania japonica]|uniref:Uncharacterized protein n=1 Tax=Stephania japonica TaxID=461633 RepID=A0AAP0NJC4_9MAGN
MGGWAIAVHGGAGVDPNLPEERQEEAKRLLTRCLEMGVAALRSKSLSAVDVVELVVRELESDPLFNSGRGSALTAKGTVEMEASIMDGPKRRCGAVSGVSTVKNPISLARLVMDKSPHSYLAFGGAEEFARQQGVEVVDNDYFITEDNLQMLKLAKEANKIVDPNNRPRDMRCKCRGRNQRHYFSIANERTPHQCLCTRNRRLRGGGQRGQVRGRDIHWGLMNKMSGRIGDSPLIGAGTYACNLCGVSCTGEGEAIIRGTLARDVAAVMEYKGLKLKKQWIGW